MTKATVHNLEVLRGGGLLKSGPADYIFCNKAGEAISHSTANDWILRIALNAAGIPTRDT